jgi:hypothetical protein
MTSSDPWSFCLTAGTILHKSCSYTSRPDRTVEVCNTGDLPCTVRIHMGSFHGAVIVPESS